MSGPPLSLTVIVPTYQRDEMLCSLLRQLGRQRYTPFDVVVVDQTAVHGAAASEQLASLDGRFYCVRQPPCGLVQAMRRGLREARGEIVVFLDDDVVIAEDLLERHAANYADPEVGGVGGMVLGPNEQPSYTLHWVFRSRPGLRHYFFRHSYAYRIEGPVTMGCNMSYRRKAIGDGPDPRLRTHHSEADLCRRLEGDGWKVVHDPTARVVHLAAAGGTRTGKGIPQEIFTDCHYTYRTRHRGLDRLLLHAHLVWHFVIRRGVQDPRLGVRHFGRYLRGFWEGGRTAAGARN